MDCVAHQAPLSIGFPRQEYWSGLLFPSPGDFQPRDQTYFDRFDPSPALAGMFFVLLLLVFTAALWLSLVAASGVVVQGLLTGVAFCRADSRCLGFSSRRHGLSSYGTWVSCSSECGIFWCQELNPCPLHWHQILYHWTTSDIQFLKRLEFPLLLLVK